MTTTLGRKVMLAVTMVLLATSAACDESIAPSSPSAPVVETPPPPPPPPPPPVPETDIMKATERRIEDLAAIKAALDAYYAEKGAYPASYLGLRGFVELGEDWIPGLAPEFMATLPRDPLLSDTNDGPQYLYISDEKDFKLIAVTGNAGRCGPDVERQGVRIDPSRFNENGCWGFGFWTANYEKH